MLSTLTYLLILAPLLAAGIVALSPARLAKWIATFGSLVILGIAVAFAIGLPNWDDGGFAPAGAGLAVMPSLGVTLSLGTDSVGLLLILLTTFLMPLAMIG